MRDHRVPRLVRRHAAYSHCWRPGEGGQPDSFWPSLQGQAIVVLKERQRTLHIRCELWKALTVPWVYWTYLCILEGKAPCSSHEEEGTVNRQIKQAMSAFNIKACLRECREGKDTCTHWNLWDHPGALTTWESHYLYLTVTCSADSRALPPLWISWLVPKAQYLQSTWKLELAYPKSVPVHHRSPQIRKRQTGRSDHNHVNY